MVQAAESPLETSEDPSRQPQILKADKVLNESSSNNPKSSTPPPSPGSSGGRRGRSRTRSVPGTGVHSHITDPDAEGNQARQGYHALMSSFGKVFHVEKRWKLIREMGSGAYGYVISAVDEISGEPVAIKLVTRVTQKIQLAKRALRELTLLRHFSHENITGLIDVDISPNLDEIYIFMEPMEADLHQIIKSGQSLTVEHVQYFVYQILRGMKYIHSASVVHRDLKPGNLLVNADCELKICDFGLSRGYNAQPDENPTMMTEYVATRWYRAPEIMLAYRRYNTAVDIWAIGCIVAELMLGKPLFKGKDYVDQLNKILDVLGTPEEQVIRRIGSEKAQAYLRSLPLKKANPLSNIIPDAEAEALEFLQELINFDPAKRPTAEHALAHPWLATYHDEGDEPSCPRIFDRWHMIEKLETLEEYRDALAKEVKDCRREMRNLAAASPVVDSRVPASIQEDGPVGLPSQRVHESPVIPQAHDERGTHSRRPTVSRRTSAEPSVPEEGVAFPTTNDPVIAYSRRSIFGPLMRTSSNVSHTTMYGAGAGAAAESTFSQPGSANPHQGQGQSQEGQESTVAFPTTEYVRPGRHRTASMFTVGGGGSSSDIGQDVRRLLRTLSTVSIYESGEGLAGGLADVAPIGRYIVQKDRTGDDAVASEMPKDILGESTESPSDTREAGNGDNNKRRFRV